MMVRIWSIPLLSVVLLVLGCERMETVETVYPNFEAAVNAKAVGDGRWIPGFLPPSATSIHEVHNIDTNEVWLFFRLDIADIPTVANSCKQVTGREVIHPRKSPGSWWPRALVQHSEDSQRTGNIYEYYGCKERSVIAIDWNKNEAYFWDLSS